MRCPWVRVLVAVVALGMAVAAPVTAFAQEAEPSAEATSVYELDFTLPSESRSGCMVCHGDPALVRIREGAEVSFFIDEADTAASTHADQQCVGCHVDFAYRAPHGDENWSITARSACRNCHEDQSRSVGESVHRPVVATEATDDDPEAVRPLCGDCHGSHDIARVDQMWHVMPDKCVACHTDRSRDWVAEFLTPLPGLGAGAESAVDCRAAGRLRFARHRYRHRPTGPPPGAALRSAGRRKPAVARGPGTARLRGHVQRPQVETGRLVHALPGRAPVRGSACHLAPAPRFAHPAR